MVDESRCHTVTIKDHRFFSNEQIFTEKPSSAANNRGLSASLDKRLEVANRVTRHEDVNKA